MDETQLEEMLELVSGMGASEGMPGYRQLRDELAAARDRGDRQAEASLGLTLGTLLGATARTVSVVGSGPGLPELSAVNERAMAELTAALEAAEATGDDDSSRFALLHLADCHLRDESPAAARPLLERLVDACEMPDNVALKYEALSRLR